MTQLLRSKIKSDIFQALKNKDRHKVSLLKTIESELVHKEKNVGGTAGEGGNEDRVLFSILMKSIEKSKNAIKEMQELISSPSSSSAASSESAMKIKEAIQNEQRDLLFYQRYLPKQSSEEEIRQQLNSIYSSNAASPLTMGEFIRQCNKIIIPGSAPPKIVASIAKEIFISKQK